MEAKIVNCFDLAKIRFPSHKYDTRTTKFQNTRLFKQATLDHKFNAQSTSNGRGVFIHYWKHFILYWKQTKNVKTFINNGFHGVFSVFSWIFSSYC
jgi:hypothetical protein